MNLQEFAALKKGDKIENQMASSRGEVTEVIAQGVRVRWAADNPISFLYTVQSTAWFHWSKDERIMVCPYCGADNPPEHKPGCTSPLATP